jgi:hypothetical protein
MKQLTDTRGYGFRRRTFLGSALALGAGSFFGILRSAAAEPPPETRKIRLLHVPAICFAPQYLAEEFLRIEGFTEVEYVKNWTGYPAKSVESIELTLPWTQLLAFVPR